MSFLRLSLLALASVLLLPAAQIVKLNNGLSMRVDKADVDGEQVYITVASVVTIFSTADIKSIEPEPDPNKPAPKAPITEFAGNDTKALIRKAAKANGLPAYVIESIASVESGMRTNAVSHKGAIGVMQLMPGTARQLGVNPHDVEQNIEGGARLMRELLIKYQDDPNQVAKALAAYNAGPGAVARHGGIPPYKETRNYVRKVLHKMRAAEQSEGALKE